MFQWAWGAAAERKKKHVIFFFFFLRASGYIFISGDMMRLLPSHHSAMQRKELKIGILFIHSRICSSYDTIPGGFVLESENHLWLTDLPLKKHREQYTGKTSTPEDLDVQRHLIHAPILFNLSLPLLVQCCFYLFLIIFHFISKLKWFKGAGTTRLAFGNLQHHLRETFHWQRG